MNEEVYTAGGILRKRWDDSARTYTEWDEAGQVIESRPYTTEENAEADLRATAEAEESNKRTIESQAVTALTSNRAYLDIVGPSQAEAVAQVADLTQQMNGVIRLLLNRLDATD